MISYSFEADILAVADGEPILAVKIINVPYSYGSPDSRFEATKQFENQVLPWATLENFFRYQYDTGYGSMDCHDIVAWTETKVIYIREYDGSTSVVYVPRNPS